MDGERFDQLVRNIGVQISRRIALGPIAGLGLGGLLLFSTDDAEAKNKKKRTHRRNHRRARRRAKVRRRREQRNSAGIRLYEELVVALKRAGGDCDALLAAAQQFQEQNQDRLQRVLDQEARPGQNRALARRYQKRVTAASESLHAMLATCGFRGSTPSSSSLVCSFSAADPIDPPSLSTCGGCDCGCICPLSPGTCALMFFACVFGGSESAPNCCWFGTCINHLCREQCTNCCNCCPSLP